MNRLFKLALMSFMLAFTACEEDDKEHFDKTMYGTIISGYEVTTGDVDSISYTSAACYGILETTSIDGSSSIRYGRMDLMTESEKSDTKFLLSNPDLNDEITNVIHKEGSFHYSRTVLEGLYAGTRYYYFHKAANDRGKIKYFTTKDYDLNIKTGDVTDVDYTSLKVSGGMFNSSIMKSLGVEYTYGVAYISESEYKKYKAQGYSDTNILATKSNQLPSEDLTEDVASVTITDLGLNTTYYYCTYVKAGRIYVGDIKIFSTKSSGLEFDFKQNMIACSSINLSGSIKSSYILQTDQYEIGVAYVSDNEFKKYGDISLCSKVARKAYTDIGLARVGETIDISFDYVISRLSQNTTYHYCLYIKYDDKYYYSESLEATTTVRSEADLRNVGKAVDLGLSVLWADRNLGAGSEFDYSPMFQWGGITPYYGINDSYAKNWRNNDNFEKNYVLKPEEDAAAVYWGDGWRMPTREEFKELIDNCKHYFFEKDDNPWRYKFIGRNGNSITLAFFLNYDYSFVQFWTSSFNDYSTFYGGLLSGNTGHSFGMDKKNYYFSTDLAYYVYAIRPVKDKK